MAQIEHTEDRPIQMSSHHHRRQKLTSNRHGVVLVWASPARNALHFVVAVSAARSSSPPHVFVLRLHFHHIKVSCYRIGVNWHQICRLFPIHRDCDDSRPQRQRQTHPDIHIRNVRRLPVPRHTRHIPQDDGNTQFASCTLETRWPWSDANQLPFGTDPSGGMGCVEWEVVGKVEEGCGEGYKGLISKGNSEGAVCEWPFQSQALNNREQGREGYSAPCSNNRERCRRL